MIDTHAHLDFPQYQGQLDQILERAKTAGLTHIIQIALGPEFEKYDQAYALVQAWPQLFMAAGFHPHDAKHFTSEHLNLLRSYAKKEKVVALGEIGLDYYYEHSDKEVQKNVLAQLLDLAVEVAKPVCIHTREAAADSIEIFTSTDIFRKVGGVIHCFSGSPDEARAYIDLGAYISFSGIVTFAKAQSVQEACKIVPLDRILIETDCPYLAPVPHRGKTNEPAFVAHVANHVAALHGLGIHEFIQKSTENAKRLFAIS
ncbi:MAG: TatD family hydrolase [Bdellovibrionales bacterium]|nr:TatD family hydrolase [Bdellovibrionales bacterium]